MNFDNAASTTPLTFQPNVTVKPNKGYGTGTGTTARIREFFTGKSESFTVSQIGGALGLPSRQLSKRLAELVKLGDIGKDAEGYSRRLGRLNGF